MDNSNPLYEATIIAGFLESDNDTVRNAVASLLSAVQSSASLSLQTIAANRERISDATDHLDGVLSGALGLSQVEEIEAIANIGSELNAYYDRLVCRQGFTDLLTRLEENIARLEARELELEQKEAQLERVIKQRVQDAEARVKEQSTSSQWLFESALQKAEKVFDQNKITRFVCSTISRFQDEFDKIRSDRDVEHVTRLFQQTIEPFQTAKMVADRHGKLTRIMTNTFSEECYQDLFLFFYKYYNELIDIYEESGALPSTADELSRIFRRKKKSAAQIIARMHKVPRP